MQITEIRTALAQLDVRRAEIEDTLTVETAAKAGAELVKLDATQRALKKQLAKAERAALQEGEQRRAAMTESAKQLALESLPELKSLIRELRDQLVALGVTLAKIDKLRNAIRSAVAIAAREAGRASGDSSLHDDHVSAALSDSFVRTLEAIGIGKTGIIARGIIEMRPVAQSIALGDAVELLHDRLAAQLALLGKRKPEHRTPMSGLRLSRADEPTTSTEESTNG
jgi:hypothetical protein